MSTKPKDINDNEIRIISANDSRVMKYKPKRRRRPSRLLLIILGLVAASAIVMCIVWGVRKSDNIETDTTNTVSDILEQVAETSTSRPEIKEIQKGEVMAIDTTINDVKVLLLVPEKSRARLMIGEKALADTSIILATQAADVRRDNGTIVGSFVLDGELISKGESKAGFCSIVNGVITVGVADATPMLEQTLTEGGYFFRQYPLVVGGQIVENKQKGRSIRKALAEIGGKIVVVMSRDILTFHDFSQLLIDMGTRNAIYLVGSTSYGFYVDAEGQRIATGNEPSYAWEFANYIVWE